MIISHILGGLGNQMFQYAAGRALALRKGTNLRVDLTGFANYRFQREFELQRVFKLPDIVASESDVRSILGWQASPLMRRILTRPGFAALRKREFVVEPHFHYWPGIQGVSADSYLHGYWQSEKYFSAFADTIRDDFSFRSPLTGKNLELAKQVEACDAVSLHVRRGDYVTDNKTSTILGACSLDYYREAVPYIARHVSRPHFFVFSDEISWAKENLKLDFPCVYIDQNRGDESYRDMQLMSLCDHHIIANSSFSWWGAWLNPRGDKIVVAPKRWFATDYRTGDLIPPEWVAL
jgi:hypothetical protein